MLSKSFYFLFINSLTQLADFVGIGNQVGNKGGRTHNPLRVT
jgi:hypothetical protein